MDYYNSMNLSTTKTKAPKWIIFSKKWVLLIKINPFDIKISMIGASKELYYNSTLIESLILGRMSNTFLFTSLSHE